MLETMRQYAREKLAESDEVDDVRDRHLTHFLALAMEAAPELTGTGQAVWLDRLEADHANLRSAMTWSSRDSSDLETAERLAVALWRFWMIHCYFSEGRKWLTHLATERSDTPVSALHARTVYAAGAFAVQQGDAEQASALNDLGIVASRSGDFDLAMPLYEQSIALNRERATSGMPLSLCAISASWLVVAVTMGEPHRSTCAAWRPRSR